MTSPKAFLQKLWLAAALLAGLIGYAQAAQPSAQALENILRCVDPASQYHKVNPTVLKAILSVESSFSPVAINKNSDNSIDVGIGQYNSRHFAELQRYGVAPKDLLDPCIATYVSAWHLSKVMARHGNTWFGIAAYHSATPCYNRRYQALLRNKLRTWGTMNEPMERVPSMNECKSSSSYAQTGSRRDYTVASNSGVLSYDE